MDLNTIQEAPKEYPNWVLATTFSQKSLVRIHEGEESLCKELPVGGGWRVSAKSQRVVFFLILSESGDDFLE